jgi:hypothetical protein
MISDEFYCPSCGNLWDCELCLECGCESKNFGRPPVKRKDEEEYRKKVLDRNKDKRPKRERKEPDVGL